MSIFIYSAKIICDGTSVGKTQNSGIGYYPDISTESNPVKILWTESRLAASNDSTTLIDAEFARSYAPVIMDISDFPTSYDPDNPVVQVNEISLTIADHTQGYMYMLDQGTNLTGQKISVCLNEYNADTLALISSQRKYIGEITNVTKGVCEIRIVCQNIKLNKNGNLLSSDSDVLTVGETGSDKHFKLLRIDTAEQPAHEILTFSLTSSFRVVGVFNTNAVYTIQLHSTVNLQLAMYAQLYAKIVGSWAFVKESSFESKDEYRKVISITPITRSEVGNPYQSNLPADYYYQIVIEGAYKNKMTSYNETLLSQVVDMYSFIEFHVLNFEYSLSKLNVSGVIDNLYIKKDENTYPIPRMSTNSNFWDVSYELTVNNTIKIKPSFIENQKTIKTYTIIPIENLQSVPDNNLEKWQSSALKVNTLFGEMFIRNRVVDGLFKKPGSTVNATTNIYNPQSISDRILHYTNSSYQAEVSHNATISPSGEAVIIGIQADIPAVSEHFTFDKVYLGMCASIWNNHHSKSIDNEASIKVLTREQSGCVNKIADIELVNNGVINTIMPQYYETYDNGGNTQLNVDWQQWTVDVDISSGVSRYTTLEKLNLKVDNINDFNKLDKVGLFFARSGGNDGVISSIIKIMEMCFIFEHKTDLTEIYI